MWCPTCSFENMPEEKACARCGLDSRGRSTEARAGRWLQEPIVLDKSASRLVVGMVRGFGQAKDGREADVGPFEDLAPFVTRSCLEDRPEFEGILWPTLSIHLLREMRLIQFQLFDQQAVELRFH